MTPKQIERKGNKYGRISSDIYNDAHNEELPQDIRDLLMDSRTKLSQACSKLWILSGDL